MKKEKIELILLLYSLCMVSLGFIFGWFTNKLLTPKPLEVSTEVEFYCGIYNHSMSCSPIDKTGNATWFFKPPCSENLTKEAICTYSLINHTFLKCEETHIILKEEIETNETEG